MHGSSTGLRYYPFPQAGQPGGSPLFTTQLFGSSLWLGPQSLAWRIVNGWGLYEETMQQLSQPGGMSRRAAGAEFRVMQSLRGRAIETYMRTLWGGGKTMKIRIPGLPRMTIQIGGCNTSGRQAAIRKRRGVGRGSAIRAVDPHRQHPAERRALARAAGERGQLGRLCPRPHRELRRGPRRSCSFTSTRCITRRARPRRCTVKELAAAVADLELPAAVAPAAVDPQGGAWRRSGVCLISVVGELQTLLADLEQARTRARAVFARSPTTVPRIHQSPRPTNGAASGIGRRREARESSSAPVVVFGG